ncbi:hypothetical protein [Granulicella paludicola]|uniref:hypothetical protein n=1 Tax=Granulicella paludicola TaxID=474951 RepID=UPI0021E01574|nr:hypothetical protein [Granulicella paludicola]
MSFALKPRRDRFLCAAAYVLVFLMLASVLHGQWGFPLDDSWIHQVIARNFAQTHHLGFIPGHLTAGSTSLLWSCLLATYWWALPGVCPVLLSTLTSLLLLAGVGYTLKALTEEDRLPLTLGWCFALAPLASGNFLWLGLIGMEHLLFVLLALCVLRRWFQPERGRGDLLQLGLLSFLFVLTRPEALFLCVFLLLSSRLAHRSFRAVLSVLSGVLAASVIFCATNWAIGHHLSPQTMQGRQFLYRVTPQAGLTLRLEFLGQIFARFLKTWSFDASRNYLHHGGLLIGVPIVCALALFAILGVRALWSTKATRLLCLCAWAALIIALYTVILPSTGHGGRYLALPMLLFLPLEFLGFYHLLLLLPPLRARAGILTLLVALSSAVWSIHSWRQALTSQVRQIETEHGGMATWLQTALPPQALAQNQVAIFDIGRMGFQLNGHLVDLGGLVDPQYFEDLSHGRLATYLFTHNVRYMVLPSMKDDDSAEWKGRLGLTSNKQVKLVPLHSVCASPADDDLAESSASTAYGCQRAYRLIYNDEPSQ